MIKEQSIELVSENDRAVFAVDDSTNVRQLISAAQDVNIQEFDTQEIGRSTASLKVRKFPRRIAASLLQNQDLHQRPLLIQAAFLEDVVYKGNFISNALRDNDTIDHRGVINIIRRAMIRQGSGILFENMDARGDYLRQKHAITADGNIHRVASELQPSKYTVVGECTMILTVYDRYATFKERLRFYAPLPCITMIFVVWNSETIPPVLEDDEYPGVEVYIARQKHNSMNNRFKPHPKITTDCIVNMDDDWNMPHEIIMYSVELWKLFTTQVVGLGKLSRLHGVDASGSYIYLTNSSMPQSITLPSGMVYHRIYLSTYSNLPKEALLLVDERHNCDDILFNFMIANETKSAPMFIDTSEFNLHVLRQGKKRGLWKRSQHYFDRHLCLNEFNRMFEGMPLMYTTTKYRMWSDHPPERGESSQRWTCTKCTGPAKDECVQCSV